MTIRSLFRVANRIRQWRKVANNRASHPNGIDQFKLSDLRKYARNLQDQTGVVYQLTSNYDLSLSLRH